MKRSEINSMLRFSHELLKNNNLMLPPFGYWSLADWKAKKETTEVIRATMLGWDITDFGSGKFHEIGAVLFTVRNGLLEDKSIGTPYAEKLMCLEDGQRLPLHYHASKTEDIINRGGGIMWMVLYNSKSDGTVDRQSKVRVFCDGILTEYAPGEKFEVLTGCSVTLVPGLYHSFGAIGSLAAGEVSSVNDDKSDNYFAEQVSRFADIEEDAPIIHPLCNEYANIF